MHFIRCAFGIIETTSAGSNPTQFQPNYDITCSSHVLLGLHDSVIQLLLPKPWSRREDAQIEGAKGEERALADTVDRPSRAGDPF